MKKNNPKIIHFIALFVEAVWKAQAFQNFALIYAFLNGHCPCCTHTPTVGRKVIFFVCVLMMIAFKMLYLSCDSSAALTSTMHQAHPTLTWKLFLEIVEYVFASSNFESSRNDSKDYKKFWFDIDESMMIDVRMKIQSFQQRPIETWKRVFRRLRWIQPVYRLQFELQGEKDWTDNFKLEVSY